jgi:hypothetical protein
VGVGPADWAKHLGSRSRGRPALIMIWGGSLFVQGDRKQYLYYLAKYIWQNICLAENNVRIGLKLLPLARS